MAGLLWPSSCPLGQLGAGMLGCCDVMHLLSCRSHGESSKEEDEEGWDSSCPHAHPRTAPIPCEPLAPSREKPGGGQAGHAAARGCA